MSSLRYRIKALEDRGRCRDCGQRLVCPNCAGAVAPVDPFAQALQQIWAREAAGDDDDEDQ